MGTSVPQRLSWVLQYLSHCYEYYSTSETVRYYSTSEAVMVPQYLRGCHGYHSTLETIMCTTVPQITHINFRQVVYKKGFTICYPNIKGKIALPRPGMKAGLSINSCGWLRMGSIDPSWAPGSTLFVTRTLVWHPMACRFGEAVPSFTWSKITRSSWFHQ